LPKNPKSPPFLPVGPVDFAFANSINLFLRASPFNLLSCAIISFASFSDFTKICLA